MMKTTVQFSSSDITSQVELYINDFVTNFEKKHLSEIKKPDGVINSKINNIFISALGIEISYYSALVRSLDSSLGNQIEKLALALAEENFIVSDQVVGPLYESQINYIGNLISDYKNKKRTPKVSDYQILRSMNSGAHKITTHKSDYMLVDRLNKNFYLIELKLGGDLDNKKASSEKTALLEQFCILSNSHPSDTRISMHFATGYNSFGEGNEWTQGRVLQFFSKEELLISSDFWNFVTKKSNGYEEMLSAYRANANKISSALETIKLLYVS